MAKVAITNKTSASCAKLPECQAIYSGVIVHFISEAEARAYISGFKAGRDGDMRGLTIKLDGREI